MKYFSTLFVVLITLAGCSSSGWIQKNPIFADSGVFLETLDQTEFEFAKNLLDELTEEVRTQAADSLARNSLREIIQSYNRGNITKARYVEDIIDAEYIIRVEEVSVIWVATLNVAHPGPNYKITVKASGWLGNEKVFVTSQSAQANMAFVAGDGARFYIPTDEDKTNPEIQRNTIYPALRTAFGKVWQEFLQADRRLQTTGQ